MIKHSFSPSQQRPAIGMASLLQIELTKLRRSHILWILLIPALILWIPSALNADINLHIEDINILPEYNFFIQGFMGMAWFMIPATLVICTVLLNQTERTNKGILKMLSLPVNAGKICLAKFLVMVLLIVIQMIFTISSYYIGALIASDLTGYDFVLAFPYAIRVTAAIYLASLPAAAVFWMLAVLISTPIFSVGIGLASLVPSVLLLNTRLWALYPMDYPFYVLMTEYGKQAKDIFTSEIRWIPLVPIALAVTILCLGAACLRFGKSEIR